MPPIFLPALNSKLNALSALLILCGYILIRRKRMLPHHYFMMAAFVVSTLFLASYLFYHAHHGATHFMGKGWIRRVYFFILITHSILAVAVGPLVLTVFFYAAKKQFDRHKLIARFAFPVWMYVSVTGVLIYWMLYHWR